MKSMAEKRRREYLWRQAGRCPHCGALPQYQESPHEEVLVVWCSKCKNSYRKEA